MAMIHYLYIGHFARGDGYVRFQNNQIVVERPLDQQVIAELLKQYLGETVSPEFLPEDWGLSISSECLVCTPGAARPALEFAADYAKQTGALVVDMGSFTLMTPDQLRELAAPYDGPVLAIESRRRSSA